MVEEDNIKDFPQTRITWDNELKEKSLKLQEHLKSNPFYKPRPPRQVQGAELIKKNLEKDLKEVEAELKKSQEKVQSLEELLDDLTKELKNKSNFNKAKFEELESLKKDTENFENWNPNSKNEQTLNDLKRRYVVLRNLTQVHFDIESCSEKTLKGYVFNSSTNRIKCFSIDKTSMSQAEVTSKLISLMEFVATKET